MVYAGVSPTPIVHLVEALGEAVIEQQPADQRLADPGDELQHLHRLQRTDDAGERAENAGLGAGRQQAFRRRLGEEVAIGRVVALLGLQRRHRAVEAADGGGDQRNA